MNTGSIPGLLVTWIVVGREVAGVRDGLGWGRVGADVIVVLTRTGLEGRVVGRGSCLDGLFGRLVLGG